MLDNGETREGRADRQAAKMFFHGPATGPGTVRIRLAGQGGRDAGAEVRLFADIGVSRLGENQVVDIDPPGLKVTG